MAFPTATVLGAEKGIDPIKVVALPELVTGPVRLALVVTVPAVKLAAVPVNPVPTPVMTPDSFTLN